MVTIKQVNAKSFLLLSASAVLALTSACTGGGGNSGGTATPQATTGADKGEPVGKYDPPVTITMVRDQETNTTFPEGDSMENNVYTRAYKDELGIEIKNEWITDSTQYWEKLNIAITSGDLPDIFRVKPSQLKELAEAGMLADLTEVYKKHSVPLTDEKFKEDGGIGLNSATINGKLYGLPYVTAAIDGATMLWVRKDWLDNLGLPEPKTMDDIINIARAFKTKDPDKNGKDDTQGFGFVKNIFGGGGGMLGFFNGYHAYPNIWFKDPSTGKLVNGLVKPETKQALAKLQALYKEGLIDKEFTTKSGIGPDVIAGKVGLFYGTMSNPLNPLQQTLDKDPNAKWHYYPITSVDSKPAKPQISYNPPHYYVVSKDSKHPAALIKLMNFFIEKTFGKTSDYKYQYVGTHSSHKYAFVRNFGVTKNVDNWKTIKEVYKSGDVSKLNPEQKGYYDQMKQYEAGTAAMWKYSKIFGPEGSLSLVDKYVNEKLLQIDEFYGLPTDNMVEKSGPMSDLANETFTKIILGDSIDNFDKFVADWNKLGGESITNEVNEWYAKNKK
ncbi:extracellular solute-binding protein [Paenibacillus sp. GD4]|uniref:extracellular solute-binding protein n=1 Tax=Paenibacillus sp. GD4 TaxID=3068890 RepID=UPI002796C521|nr:extracellular solute-binding protein [Paenibacillus sp. GD4]MDQ1908994.1 extracellular solute-binding protein [Paenibacillus sp. GD4]